MAIGDFFVSFSADNTILEVQPLGTSVLMCTSYAMDDTNHVIKTTDGVDETEYGYLTGGVEDNGSFINAKLIANNTHWFKLLALGGGKHSTIAGIEVA